MLTSAVQSARRLWKAPFRPNYMGSVPKGDAWVNSPSPAVLFSAGEVGAWYDPSDYTTLFEDAAGTIPITSPLEKPVGLMLDKSKGLVLGSELVTNGDFSNGTTGWVANVGSVTVTSGELFSSGPLSRAVTQSPITTVSGRWYKVTGTMRKGAVAGASAVAVRATTSSDGASTGLLAQQLSDTVGLNAPVSFYFAATSSTTYIALVGNGEGYFDNISVRELPGNHAYQSASSASRPTLSAKYNAYVGTETLSTQNVTTLAANYTLSFTGTGSITLSGTATGTYSAGTHTITCAAGTLTSTVTGTVTKADLRVANDALNQPAYQRVNTATDYDTVGFLPYLRFDGSDDWLVTNTITPGTDKAQVFAGVRKLSDAAAGTVVELSGAVLTNNGSFLVRAPRSAAANYMFSGGGTSYVEAVSPSNYAAPITNVFTGLGDIFGDSAILRIDGTQAGSSTADQGTGNYLAYPLYIGRRGGTTLPFNGRLYSLITRFGATLPDAQIASTERWVNRKTGAY